VFAELWEHKEGKPTHREPMQRHPVEEWAMVHTDRKIYRHNGGQEAGVLEVKSPGKYGFQRVLDQGVGENYICQLQHALWVTGRSWGAFAVGNLEHPEGPLITAEMERDPTLINELVDICRKFWHQNVLKGVPPSHVIPEPPPIPDLSGELVTVDDPAMAASLGKIIEQHGVKKEAEKLIKGLKVEAGTISFALGAEKMAVPEGKVYVSWREGRKRFNRKLLEAHRPLDRDMVRKALWTAAELTSVPAPESIEGILADCTLNLSGFEQQGDPYQDFRVYPRRGK